MSQRFSLLAIENIAVESARRSAYRALATAGEWKVDLVVPRSWREQRDVMPAEPEPTDLLRLHPVAFTFGYRHHRVIYRGLGRLLRSLRPDILYVEAEPENYAALQARAAIRLFSPRTQLALVSSRNLDYPAIGFPYRFAWTHRVCDNVIRRHPADIIFVRPRVGEELVREYAGSIVSLPHPVDCAVFAPDPEAHARRPANHITIGYVGRLVQSKGVDLLVKAIAILPANVYLEISGTGPLARELPKLISDLGLSERVLLRSAVPYSEVPGILHRLDILVLPSVDTSTWVEQFGRILIEAMACGLSIAASRSGEIPTVMGDGGILFESGSLDSLVSALRRLTTDSALRTDLGRRGRARALAQFDAPVVAAMMHRAFVEVLRSSRLPN